MDRYTKVTEVWVLLHVAEQLMINDNDYPKDVLDMINHCLDIVESVQEKIEVEESI